MERQPKFITDDFAKENAGIKPNLIILYELIKERNVILNNKMYFRIKGFIYIS
jgi:hypothetical protein